MDLIIFHKGWLGKDPKLTPEGFRITPQQIELYENYPDYKGFSSDEQSEELFIGALIVAFAQTQPGSARQVPFFIPEVLNRWVLLQTKSVARHLIRARKGDKKGIQVVQSVFDQIFIGEAPHKVDKIPEGWASFGYQKTDRSLPSWLTNGLLEVISD